MTLSQIKQSFIEFWLGAIIIYLIFIIFNLIGAHVCMIGISFLTAILQFALSPIGLLIIIICAIVKQQKEI